MLPLAAISKQRTSAQSPFCKYHMVPFLFLMAANAKSIQVKQDSARPRD